MYENIKKCKIDFSNKDGKILMRQRGYCDNSNPNKIMNRDIEIDFDSMEQAMNKTFKKFEDGS